MNPAEFIPLAENEGMIAQVTDYVVDELFYEMGEFLASHPQLYIAINLSASDFHSARLISQIVESAQLRGLYRTNQNRSDRARVYRRTEDHAGDPGVPRSRL